MVITNTQVEINGARLWRSPLTIGQDAARWALLSVSSTLTLVSVILSLRTGSGWAGTVYFMDPTTGVAAVFGTQILPGRDIETTKLYKEFEEALYSGLVDD